MIRFNKNGLYYEKVELSRYIGLEEDGFIIFEYEKPLFLEKSFNAPIKVNSINYVTPQYGISMIEEINDDNFANIIVTNPIDSITITFNNFDFINKEDKIKVFLYFIKPQEFKERKVITEKDRKLVDEFSLLDIQNNYSIVKANLTKYFKKDELFVEKSHYFIDVVVEKSDSSIIHLSPYNKNLNIYGFYFVYMQEPYKPLLLDINTNNFVINNETPINVLSGKDIDGFCYKIERNQFKDIYKITNYHQIEQRKIYTQNQIDTSYGYVYYQIHPRFNITDKTKIQIGVYKELDTYLNKKLILYSFSDEFLVNLGQNYKPQNILLLLGDYEYVGPDTLLHKQNITITVRYVVGKITTQNTAFYVSKNADKVEIELLDQNNEVIASKWKPGIIMNNIGVSIFYFDKELFLQTNKIRIRVFIDTDGILFKPLNILINKSDLYTNNNISYFTSILLIEYKMSNNIDTYQNNENIIPYL